MAGVYARYTTIPKKYKPNFVAVHRNQFFKFRPEPDLAGTGKKFRLQLPAGTGTDSLKDNGNKNFYCFI